MRKTIIILLSLIIINFIYPFKAIGDNYLFTQLSISEGFPSSIQNIHAETDGFVWLGYKNGLAKFDGFSLKRYSYAPDDQHSLPSNEILQIIEDKQHRIWILTSQGLTIYNREKDNFDLVYSQENHLPILATAACEVNGNIYFITSENIYQSIPNEKRIQLINKIEKLNITFNELWKWDEKHIICINKWHGAYLLNLQSGKLSLSPIPHSKNLSRIFIDHKNRIWTTIYNKGLICYTKQGDLYDTFNTENSNLSHNVILCINEYQGKIWVGTDGGGINIIDPETKEVKTLNHISGDKNSLPTSTIQCISSNNSNGIWTGSVKGGVIHIQKSFIQTYTDVTTNTHYGLTKKEILSFYQEKEKEKEKNIWIGTDGGGINSFNQETLQFTHYPLSNNQKVVSICNYNHEKLIISLFSKGIYLFDKQTGKLTDINNQIPYIKEMALYGRKSITLYQDEPGSVLISSNGIFKYNFTTEKIQRISPPGMTISQAIGIGTDSIYTYLHDISHIYAIRKSDNDFKSIFQIKSGNIYSATKDPNGNFWIATSNGVVKFNQKEKKKKLITEIPSQNLEVIICDSSNRIWTGAGEKLFVWHPTIKELTVIDKSDGIISNEYLNKASWVSQRGNIFLGGVNGMLYINANEFYPSTSKPSHITLTNIEIDQKKMLSDINRESNSLKISHGNHTLYLQVMSHEDNIMRKKKFKWYIEGNTHQIIETNEPQLTLQTLQPDYYHISVACSLKNGQWSEKSPILSLLIPDAWYKSGWIILLFVIITASLTIFIILNILHRKEEKVAMALQEQKEKIYEEKVRFLININHELRTPLTLVYTPLNDLLKRIKPDNDLYTTLKNMQKHTLRMKEMLNLVLNLRKMEMVDTKLNLGIYQLNEWIKEVGNDFNCEEKENKIKLQYELDPLVKLVEFDQERNLIILTNFITNAFKHTPENKYITLKTELTHEGKFVKITVSDQGIGLQKIDPYKLFTRFYQGENEKGGNGIGLSYAKILVEQHHGKIGAYNNSDEGASFFYEIPVKQLNTSNKSLQKDYLNHLPISNNKEIDECYTPLTNDIDTTKYSCLFADDNNEMQELAINLLGKKFKNLYIASNGKEALRIALTEIPDIIISDVMMPQMNGYELCQKIKENPNINHIQIILLTARIDKEGHMNGFRTGADAYLDKPFEIDVLMENIKNRLHMREIIRQRYMITSTINEETNPIKSTDDMFLFKLNKLIIQNIGSEELNINMLCKELGVSRATLYNKVKTLCMLSPNEYINKVKIECAMEMLRKGTFNITEIAEHTGFSSGRYFSTTFKKFTGITPSQYKENPELLSHKNL